MRRFNLGEEEPFVKEIAWLQTSYTGGCEYISGDEKDHSLHHTMEFSLEAYAEGMESGEGEEVARLRAHIFNMNTISHTSVIYALDEIDSECLNIGQAIFDDDNEIKEHLFDKLDPCAETFNVIEYVEVRKAWRRKNLGKAIVTLFMKQFSGNHALMAEDCRYPWLRKFYSNLGFFKVGTGSANTIFAQGMNRLPKVSLHDGIVHVDRVNYEMGTSR